MKQRILIIVLMALAPASARGQTIVDSTATPISLSDAIRMAQRNAPSAIQARGTLLTSSAGVKQAWSAFLPTISVGAGSQRQQGDRFDPQGNLVPYTGQPTTYSTSLSSSIQLFDGGRRFFDLNRARADVDAAEAGETAQKYQISLQVKQQYYASLAARESEEAANAQLEQANQQLKAASIRLKAGAATVSDSLRSVIQVGNARLALLTAQNNRSVADATLTRLVSSARPVTANPADTADQRIVVPDIAELEQLATKSPSVLQADAQLAAAHANVRSAKAAYLPTVNLNFNRSGSGLDSRFGSGDARYAYNQNLSFSLNFPLFNNLNREMSVVRANVAEETAAATFRDMKFLARQTLVQSLGQMRTAQQQVAIQAASVAAAVEDLRVQQRRYELGATTLLDLLTSQTQLDQARAALIRARYDYRIAKAQLEALIGRDL
ncbi:MAG TPA: TolC family protein [Gemmatimonadaceae bacterium]